MGTSTSYGGPTGPSPLLPAWAQPTLPPPPLLTPNPEVAAPNAIPGVITPVSAPPQIPTFDLRGAKTSMTRFARSGGSGGGNGRSVRGPARSYVRGRGGPRGAATAASSGRMATGRLAGFLANVATHGVDAAARQLGLDSVVGKNLESVLATIVNAIAPTGATLEEAAARLAIDDAIGFLCEQFALEENGFANLDTMNEAAVGDALQVSVTGYIYHRWLQELGLRIAQNAVTPRQAVRLERQVKEYIEDTVKLDFSSLDILHLDWSGPVARQAIERIYIDAYSFLET